VFEKRRKKETIATTGNVDRGELWGSKTGGIHASMSEILIFLPLTAKVDSLQGGMALDCASMLCCAVLFCFRHAPGPDPCVFLHKLLFSAY
jgi:hypothetical protein